MMSHELRFVELRKSMVKFHDWATQAIFSFQGLPSSEAGVVPDQRATGD